MKQISKILSSILRKKEILKKLNHQSTTNAANNAVTKFMYYDSSMDILVAGDGDFGFSNCLARNLVPASRIVATSIDSYDLLTKKYPYAEKNVRELLALGAQVYHQVNVRSMKTHPSLSLEKYHVIVFNFPHAGFKWKEDDFRMISKHRELVGEFLENASALLKTDGEIHVTHKIGGPYDKWLIEDEAAKCGLRLLTKVNFTRHNYPGYYPKFGAGKNPGENFAVGVAKTFKFVKVKQD